MDGFSYPFAGTKLAVFGATGNLGKPITTQLHLQGATVYAFAQQLEKLKQLKLKQLPGVADDRFFLYPVNIHHLSYLGQMDDLPKLPQLDGYIYCIGHCPPRGFDNDVQWPLSDLEPDELTCQLKYHVEYLSATHKYLLSSRCLKSGASIVVIGSAITRLTEDTCPPWLHAWHYITATAAKEMLVRGMRHDPASKNLDLRIHYLAFGAVDTPFHDGATHRPPAMLRVRDVVDEVLAALQSDEVIHKQVMPKQPAAT